MNYTTLNKIKEHSPCESGWKKLLASLGKTKADDEPVSLLHIVESNGIEDAIWALQASDATDRDMRLFAVWCARQVQHLMSDERSINALDVAERFAIGEATSDELAAAWESAWASEWESAWASAWESARASARESARASAWESARASARESARASAWESARASARESARASAWESARESQKARFIEVFCKDAA